METLSGEIFCLVCGNFLTKSPWEDGSASFEICECCGIQFGYSDIAGGDLYQRQEIYRSWRKTWVDSGMKWDQGRSSPPAHWNPFEQLRRVADPSSLTH